MPQARRGLRQSGASQLHAPSPLARAGTAKLPSYVLAAEKIRLDILAGVLSPGDKLPVENELAAELKVSRTTAREALRLLSSERLVRIERGTTGGVFVAHPDSSHVESSLNTAFYLMLESEKLSLDEIMEVQLILGPVTARMAAERRTDEEAAELMKLVEPPPDDAADNVWVEAAFRISTLMNQMTRSRILPLLTRPLLRLLLPRLEETRREPKWWPRNWKDYERIALAIYEGDGSKAEQESRRHSLKLIAPNRKSRRPNIPAGRRPR